MLLRDKCQQDVSRPFLDTVSGRPTGSEPLGERVGEAGTPTDEVSAGIDGRLCLKNSVLRSGQGPL